MEWLTISLLILSFVSWPTFAGGGLSGLVGGKASREEGIVPSPLAILAPQNPESRATFQAGVRDVLLTPEVFDRNGAVIGMLTRADFLIYDEGEMCSALYFGRESVPLDLVVLLDVSGSVQKSLREIAAVSSHALQALQPADRAAVMLFSRDIWIEQSFTSDRQEIAEAIQKAGAEPPPGSGTRIYAAVRSAARYLEAQQSGQIRRRAILIVTDNDGMSYDVHKEEALRSLLDGAITLDAVVVGRHPHPPAPRNGTTMNPDFAFDDVFPLADQTGGEALATNKPKDSLDGVLHRIRERYVLVYSAPRTAVPGAFRHIRVELASGAKAKFPRATIRVRGGYYVNGPTPAGGPGQ